MQKWEYRLFQFVKPDLSVSLHHDISELNALGEQGWEALSMEQVAGYEPQLSLTVLLKRKKESATP